jgi:transposase-like protein
MEKKHMVDVTHHKGEEMEGAHKGSEVSSSGEPVSPRRLSSLRDPEVSEKAVRRRYTAAYKLRVLREAGGCKETGQCSTLLRREGLYSSHLTTWRRQAEQGTLEALSPRKRGPKVQKHHPLMKRVETLEKENQQLRHQLKQAETIIEVQKKISEMLHLSPDPKGEKS